MTPTASERTPLTYGRDPAIAKWTVQQYDRMVEAGIFDPMERVELLEGWIVWRDVPDPGKDGVVPAAARRVPVTYGRDPALATFTVEQYRRMIECGILTSVDRVELLENWVVLKMPHNPPHDGTIQGLALLLTALLPQGWGSRIQSTLDLVDGQPEPDVLLVRGHWRTFTTRHPLPSEVGIVIEVAHSSLLRDRRDKVPMYANAGLVRYWIVNLVDDCIEVYEQPSGPAASPEYASVTVYRRGEGVPFVLDGVTLATVAVADVLP